MWRYSIATRCQLTWGKAQEEQERLFCLCLRFCLCCAGLHCHVFVLMLVLGPPPLLLCLCLCRSENQFRHIRCFVAKLDFFSWLKKQEGKSIIVIWSELTVSSTPSMSPFFWKDLVNGHSIKVCQIESLSPQYRHSSSVLMPNMNRSFIVITILWTLLA